MTKEQSTAVATIDGSSFAVAQTDPAELKMLIQENLANQSFGPRDLDIVPVPTGGGLMWSIPSLDGEVEAKTIDGVIVYVSPTQRVFWPKTYTGERIPPSCKSTDGITGVGNPGGSCMACPNAEWGSKIGDNGDPMDGYACRQKQFIAIIREGDRLPLIIAVPPSSLRFVNPYLMRLTKAGKFYWGVVTRVSLERDKSRTGIIYTRICLGMVGAMAPDVAMKFKAFSDAIRPVLAQVQVDARTRNEE